MISSLLVLLASALPPSPASSAMPESALQALAEQSFAEGSALRQDGAKARRAFARAAIAYDELWLLGCHNPELALDRAHAHQLAGDLPGAIAALHEGLAEARWHRPLQVALEETRSTVAYPLASDLAAQCRPAPPATISSRMSPLEAWAVAGLAWLLVCAGIARFAMTRRASWLAVATAAAVVLAMLGVMWQLDLRERERSEALPLVIVTADVYLRRGNAEAWPERLEARLPTGVEARELARRGGWVQVQLAGGVIGWLPETAVKATP